MLFLTGFSERSVALRIIMPCRPAVCQTAIWLEARTWHHTDSIALFLFFIIMIVSGGTDIAAVDEFIPWHWTMFSVSVKEGKSKPAGPLREAWFKLSPMRPMCSFGPTAAQSSVRGNCGETPGRGVSCFYYWPPSRHIQNCFHMFPTVTREAAAIYAGRNPGEKQHRRWEKDENRSVS